jgi:MoxR-like ATPase
MRKEKQKSPGKSELKILGDLRRAIETSTKGYIRTTPLVSYGTNGKQFSLDIRDLIMVGAITQSDILLTGKTGSGKTSLACQAMQGFFGPGGHYAKTMLPTMNPAEFMEMDFPAILEGRKTLRQAVSGIESLAKPGIVLNEINRAPAVIQSMLIAFIDRELEVQGVPVQMGRKHNGGAYQFRIFTINEGGTYHVCDIDPAIRDRMTIEVPIDAFPQTENDTLTMITGQGPSHGNEHNKQPQPPFNDTGDHFAQVVQLQKAVNTIPLQSQAAFFLNYLAGLSRCTRAPLGNKESITLSPDVCDGCHHMAAFYNLCGNITAPSARILLKLRQLAQAFALFRRWKMGPASPLTVVVQDIIAAAPFVLYSKLNINTTWLRTAGGSKGLFLGDRWTAIKNIMAWIHKKRFLPLINSKSPVGDIVHRVYNASPIRKPEWETLYKYLLEDDPWVCDPAMVRQRLSETEDHD